MMNKDLSRQLKNALSITHILLFIATGELRMAMNLLLKCNDIEQTKNFYSTALQFNVSDTAEGTCTVQKAGGTIIFSTGDNLGTTPTMSGTIYFFAPRIDEYFNSVKDHVDIQWPLQDMSYGTREFGMKDCNGYYLAFAQDQEI